MESSIKRKIRGARPRLRKVSPLTWAICWGFAGVNAILGLGMVFTYRGNTAPIAIASILSYPQWGVAFLAVAALMVYGLFTNNWDLERKSQLAGLTMKAIWLIALIVRCVQYPQTILITGVWLFLVYVQAAVYIYFLPPVFASEEHDE